MTKIKVWRHIAAGALCALLSRTNALQGQEVRLLSEASISSVQDGSSDWYDIEGNPENRNNLIACGMKWNAQENANYGYVYTSEDGGKRWNLTLEEKGSKWVSEESCAFGAGGVAYFIADPSKVDNLGALHHDQGITHIWVSHDGGRSWKLASDAGWTDFSAPVVDRNPGANQNRVYVFFNNLWTYYTSVNNTGKSANLPKPSDKINTFDTAGNTIGLLSYGDGENRVNGPIYDSEMYRQGLRGAYPGQSLLLRDNSLLTLFWSKKRVLDADGKQRGREFILAAQHTDPQRKGMSAPAFIQKSLDSYVGTAFKCSSYLSAPAAYDRKTNTVYATYLDGSKDKCSLMLAKSIDNGETWSSSVWAEKTATTDETAALPEHDYGGLALARREDGTLALLWHDSDRPGVWLFAISTDDGKTYSHPQQISIAGAKNGAYHVTNDSLEVYVSEPNEKRPTSEADLHISNHAGWGDPHINGIAVTPDGVFHPIWTNNGGQLYTAAIAVTKRPDRTKSESPLWDGWQYETNRVKFTYGGSQRYDEREAILTETIILRNASNEILKGPLRLEITPNSHAGVIYSLDATTEGSGDSIGQYVDVSQYIPGDGLASGASSMPISLRFHFEPYGDTKQNSSVANVSLRLLTKEKEK